MTCLSKSGAEIMSFTDFFIICEINQKAEMIYLDFIFDYSGIENRQIFPSSKGKNARRDEYWPFPGGFIMSSHWLPIWRKYFLLILYIAKYSEYGGNWFSFENNMSGLCWMGFISKITRWYMYWISIYFSEKVGIYYHNGTNSSTAEGYMIDESLISVYHIEASSDLKYGNYASIYILNLDFSPDVPIWRKQFSYNTMMSRHRLYQILCWYLCHYLIKYIIILECDQASFYTCFSLKYDIYFTLLLLHSHSSIMVSGEYFC